MYCVMPVERTACCCMGSSVVQWNRIKSLLRDGCAFMVRRVKAISDELPYPNAIIESNKGQGCLGSAVGFSA